MVSDELLSPVANSGCAIEITTVQNAFKDIFLQQIVQYFISD